MNRHFVHDVHTISPYGKILENHGKILLKSWLDLVKVMARSGSWQHHGKILQNHGKITQKPVLATYKVKQLFTVY